MGVRSRPLDAASPLLVFLVLVPFCCSLLAACGDGSIDTPPAEESGTAAAPDLSYPGEEAGTAAIETPPESQVEAEPSEPGMAPPLEPVKIFLVELEADGEDGAAGGGDTFGCGDRLRAMEVPVAVMGLDTAGRIGAALRPLLATEGGPEVPDDLYNVFDRSRLTVERVAPVGGVEGLYRVELAGDLVLGGVCDNPRVRAQLEATARQFAGVEELDVAIGGEPLEAVLRGRGH